MSRASRDREYRRLLEEVGGSDYVEPLRQLQCNEPELRRFASWTDLITFMHEGSADGPKEEALLAIFHAHAADADPRWRSVLLAIFWPGIESVFHSKRRWDSDSEMRWQNTLCAFFQTVCRLDVARRSDHLIQRVINGTAHRLHDEYRREWKHATSSPSVDDEVNKDTIPGGEEVAFDVIDLRMWQESEIARLREHLNEGHISEADFLLLVATRVYGMSAGEYAREIDVSRDLVKKRRRRAEAAIRKAKEER